jgi:hypothetical protein
VAALSFECGSQAQGQRSLQRKTCSSHLAPNFLLVRITSTRTAVDTTQDMLQPASAQATPCQGRCATAAATRHCHRAMLGNIVPSVQTSGLGLDAGCASLLSFAPDFDSSTMESSLSGHSNKKGCCGELTTAVAAQASTWAGRAAGRAAWAGIGEPSAAWMPVLQRASRGTPLRAAQAMPRMLGRAASCGSTGSRWMRREAETLLAGSADTAGIGRAWRCPRRSLSKSTVAWAGSWLETEEI